jgi:Ca2+-binding RTX toxin-like protein
MKGTRLLCSACLAAALAVVALAMPAVAPAHQIANLSGGVMTITGDQPLGDIPKPNDLITVDWDAANNEYIFGQDLFYGHPAVCSPDATNPQRIIHCPASAISSIVIKAGIGSDTVCADSLIGAPNGEALAACRDVSLTRNASLKVSMGSGSDRFQGGPEKDNANGGSGSDQLYGGGGADKLFGGPAPDRLFGGPGNDTCKPGGGVGKESSC